VEKITLKQKEAKTVKFTIKDEAGNVVDVSGATLSFQVKKSKSDTTPKISKTDTDFDKAQAASGIVTVNLTTTDTNLDPGVYVAELKIEFTATNIDKSADIVFEIQQAVIL